jgi:type IV pilus assembly protein PilC
MAKFSYTGTRNGKPVSGTIEASSQDAAYKMLGHQDVHILILNKEKDPVAFLKLIGGGGVKQKELVVFTRQLSTMISAGVPLVRALSTLKQQTESKNFGTIIASISKDIEGGLPLAEALSKHPNAFNDIYVNMVRAGESGGILDEILKRLATQVEKDATIKKKIKSASAYPLAILTFTIIAFFGIMIFVIPKLGKIIKDLGGPDAKLPIYTQIMLNLSDFLVNNAFIIIVIAAVGIFMLRRYVRTPVGKYNLHYLLLKTPILNTILIKIAVARFARTFASLMGAGVSVLDALEVTGGAVGNKVIEKELKSAAAQVRNGKQLSEPLSQSAYFPPIVPQMLAVGEETGETDTILLKVADFYEEEVDAVIDGLSSLIEPVMIIVLGSLVGLIAASVMGPIASLSQNVSADG